MTVRDPRSVPEDDPPPPLAGWLLDRLAEREQDADEIHNVFDCGRVSSDPATPFPCDCGDPARVLAEVAAKRRIVERLHHQPTTGIRHGDEEYVSCVCGWDRVLDRSFDWDGEYAIHLAELGVNDVITDAVLRLLALPYADHPTYRQEWKP